MLNPQVPPGQKVPCDVVSEKHLLYKEPDQAPAEDFGHLLQTGQRHADNHSVCVEPSLQNQVVKVRIPTQPVAKGLM